MATKAHKQSKRTKRAKQRSDTLKDYWTGGKAPSIRWGNDEWQVLAYRSGLQTLDLSDVVTAVGWEDSGPMLTGTVSLMHPATHPKLNVVEGHVLQLNHRHAGEAAYHEVWQMRLGPTEDAQTTISVKDGTYEYTVADDLAYLASSKTTFKVRKDKANPNGVLVSEAIRRLCRQESIPVAPLPRLRHRVKKSTWHNQSVLDILMNLLRMENVHEDKDYRLRWRRGRLEVIRQQRSPYLTEMADTILDATLTLARKQGFATVLDVQATPDTGKGKDSKGHHKHKKRKINTTVTRTSLVQRFGRIKRKLTVDAHTVAEARVKGKRELARLMRAKRQVTFTHAGTPLLRRHDALRLSFPDQGIEEIAYVQTVSHSVSSGQYDMEVTMRFTDPFAAEAEREKKARKAEAARRRHRKSRHHEERKHKHKPKTHRQRGDTHAPSAKPYKRSPGQQLSDRGLEGG
jgi:hypothetical protein